MTWFTWIFLIALVTCLASLITHLIVLIRSGIPVDYAPPSGKISAGIVYSFTGAMSPVKKESAYLHLPTYSAGMIYHLGTFISIILIFLIWTGVVLPPVLSWCLSGFIMISALCGIGILLKRILKKELRALSNPDDYLSNILVTVFQVLTCLSLVTGSNLIPWLFVWGSLLLLYIPLGKLKHLLYFFAARWQLGLFFGRRGVWPPQKNQKP